jgi:hypothetical protein
MLQLKDFKPSISPERNGTRLHQKKEIDLYLAAQVRLEQSELERPDLVRLELEQA